MADFKVGDIITGKNENGYSYTNDNALMVVIEEIDNYNMRVHIIAHVLNRSEVNSKYNVENSENRFEKIEPIEFFEYNPKCYRLPENELKEIISDYKEPEPEPVNIDEIITPEERTRLLEEMKNFLVEYSYHPTDFALNKIIDEWATNKADLIKGFKKHPNYNGWFQIQFDTDYERKINHKDTESFREYLFYSNEVKDFFKSKTIDKIGAFTYEELLNIISRLKGKRNAIKYLKDCDVNSIVIDGETDKDIIKEFNRFYEMFEKNYERNPDIVIYNRKIYPKDVYKNERIICNLVDDILDYHRYTKQFISKETEERFNNICPEAKIKKGQKLSRAVNKICKMTGINKLPNYNKEFAKFADAVNPLMIKRHTVISINPIDYLTMSFGNSWASCHTIDKQNKRKMPNSYEGQYSSGTESYMLDGSTIVFYTVDSKYDGNAIELEPKINRNMFHYGDDQLIQGRMYPQNCDSGEDTLYENVRNIVQKVMADILEKDNFWNLSRGTDACNKVTVSYGTHYRDYLNFDNCNVSTLKSDKKRFKKIIIGHNPICPSCGEEHSDSECIECDNCYHPNCCYECGSTDDLRYIDGNYYCSDHYYYCEYHEEYESGNPYFTDRDGRDFCATGADETFSFCDNCGEYIDYDNYITTEDGHCYCNHCCAERAGYRLASDRNWYDNDSVFCCSHCGEIHHINDCDEEMDSICTNCAEEIRNSEETEEVSA